MDEQPGIEELLQGATVVPDAGPQAAKSVKVYTLAEMLAPQPPQEWVIENLLLPASVDIFSGQPGCKKTWALVSLAACVASGTSWLGRRVKQTSVLIVDEKSGRFRLFNRMAKVVRGLGITEDAPIYSTVMEGFNLKEDTSALHAIINDRQVGLVVIDALADVSLGADENSAKDMMPLMANLRRLAEATQTAIILVHHDTKAKTSAYRGSSAIAGAVALLVSVSSAPGESLVRFEIVKAWDTERQTFYGLAEWDALDDTFILRETTTTKMPKFSPAETFVLNFLGDNGQATVEEVQDNAAGCSPSSARKALYILAQGGWVEKANLTGSGRGNKAIYKLSARGKEVYEKLLLENSG